MKRRTKKNVISALRWLQLPVYLFALSASLIGQAAYGEEATNINKATNINNTNEDSLIVGSADILSETDLEAHRGSGGTTTTTTVASNQSLSATSTGNVVNVTGDMTNGSIGNSTFGGSGFGSYVMNTGNNSTINSGVSLSVLMMQ
jgi:hypothetical protein